MNVPRSRNILRLENLSTYFSLNHPYYQWTMIHAVVFEHLFSDAIRWLSSIHDKENKLPRCLPRCAFGWVALFNRKRPSASHPRSVSSAFSGAVPLRVWRTCCRWLAGHAPIWEGETKTEKASRFVVFRRIVGKGNWKWFACWMVCSGKFSKFRLLTKLITWVLSLLLVENENE